MHRDPRSVTGDRLVHRVIDDFREQVMQRFLVRAADVHAGPPADRLEPLEHLDIGSRIVFGGVDFGFA